MAMEYFCCYHSYLKKCGKLTDQELGRLFRALLAYSGSGQRQELAGRESIAFDFIADDIDRARAAYESKCQANAENGRRGGRAKSLCPVKRQGVLKKAGAFFKSQRFLKKANKAITKAKKKTKPNKKREGPPPGTPPDEPSLCLPGFLPKALPTRLLCTWTGRFRRGLRGKNPWERNACRPGPWSLTGVTGWTAIAGRTWMGQVLRFSQQDRFWQANILSGGKFREKYVQLLAKMQAEKTGRLEKSSRVEKEKDQQAFPDYGDKEAYL